MKLIKLLPYFTYLLSFSFTQAQCDFDQSQERWFIDLEKYGSSQLALCGGNYNCHLFALSYFDKPNSSSTKICNDIAYNWSGVTDYLTEYI